jgi:hypothetical protein
MTKTNFKCTSLFSPSLGKSTFLLPSFWIVVNNLTFSIPDDPWTLPYRNTQYGSILLHAEAGSGQAGNRTDSGISDDALTAGAAVG